MYPNFGAMGSVKNNEIEIGKEDAVGCVLSPEEPVTRQCTGKCIRQKKTRGLSRRGQTKENFV